MQIKSWAERVAALARAKSLTEAAAKAGRELTAEEVTLVTDTTAAVKAYDATPAAAAIIERQRKGAALMASLTEVGPDYEHGSPLGDGPGYSPQPKAGRLSFKGLGDQMASQMRLYSAKVSPYAKGLVPAGETVVAIPVVNPGSPFAGDAGVERPPRLVDVLPIVSRSSAVYRYLKQVTPTAPVGAAGVVAAGDVKPTKKLSVVPVDARLRVIAVLSEPQDKFMLEDSSDLKTWAGVQLADAIEAALETEVLSGDGTGEHFTGISETSGIQTQAFVTDALVTLQYGLSKLQSLGIAPAFIALPAADWLAIQTTRNASGAFDVGGPIDATAHKAWGVQVVVVPGLTPGVGYVVGENTIQLSVGSGGLDVEWGTPGDAFTRNQLVARVEGRFNLDVIRPHGIVQLTLAQPEG